MLVKSWSHRRRVITLEGKAVTFNEEGIANLTEDMAAVVKMHIDDALEVEVNIEPVEPLVVPEPEESEDEEKVPEPTGETPSVVPAPGEAEVPLVESKPEDLIDNGFDGEAEIMNLRERLAKLEGGNPPTVPVP